MPTIRQLPPSVVNKIAAGEVIERPASVVKELVENALDAGATRIDVSVERGGSELIRVADNGCGIEAEQLPLAVASHATSKIDTADDLFRVGTLGFRGEALASIAEVSRLVIRSRTTASTSGAELEVAAGRAAAVAPCGCPIGSSVAVYDLFCNTPVRRKFLRSTQTEMGHIAEAFTRLALAHPELHFTLRHNEREVYDLPPADPWLARITRLLGQELAEELIWVESRDGDVRLSGYVAHPSQSRSNQKMQFLFLNRRHIRDRSLQHALGEAYRGLLLTGRYPISCLAIDMPPALVDVNVHPTKLEVRFQDAGRLYSQLLGTLRTKFLTSDLSTPFVPPGRSAAAAGREAPMPYDPHRAAEVRRELVDWAKGEVARWAPPPGPPAGADPLRQATLPAAIEAPPRAPLDLVRLGRQWPAATADDEEEPGARAMPTVEQDAQAHALRPALQEVAPGSYPRALGAATAMQVHNRYLVAESAEGVVVIDQHALHERILYEQLSEKVLAGGLESQSLLVPEPVDLSGGEAARVLESRDLLARLGFAVEPFGGDTVLLTSYPALLAHLRPVEIFREIVDQLAAGAKAPDRRDLLDELLHSMACQAAIKAGDRLTPAEVAALIEQRGRFRDTHHCPHGRPTELVFTREELDRQFKRT